MLKVSGHVQGPEGSTFTAYTVSIAYQHLISIADGSKPQQVAVREVRSAAVAPDGAYQLDLPEFTEISAPITANVSAPNGIEVAKVDLAKKDLQNAVDIEATPFLPLAIQPNPNADPKPRLSGRVIDDEGRLVPAGLPIVIWGLPAAEAAPPAGAVGPSGDTRPLVITQTQIGGYFTGDWVPDSLSRADGVVAGSASVPIPLDKGQLPARVLLVTRLPDSAFAADDCGCGAPPPRVPGQTDLTQNPAAYSQDLGGGCVNLTTPNRVLEEFPYFLLVRTTEPGVKGLTEDGRRYIPPGVVRDLVDLAGQRQTFSLRGNAQTRALVDSSSKLQLDVATARQLVRTRGSLTIDGIHAAALSSELGDLLNRIDVLRRDQAARSPIDPAHRIDWDDKPTIYESTSVAHGHVLLFKQVWRADGYSLGDLLYSLPLAPGQKRQIAVLDWERRETSVRTESLESEEALDAINSRDRDISEITGSRLSEEMAGGSNASTWGVAGGIGAGFIGSGFGIFGGIGGGASGASADAWQNSSREFSANSMQQLSDRTMQRASALRSERSTVVQTVAQGETVRAQTEVVANHNHCHAMTVEYFEVLRHFQVSHELAEVRECLFVPLPMSYFDQAKAARWREALTRFLRDRTLLGAFDAIERIQHNWDGWDFPQHSYAEEAPNVLEGELRINFLLPRPHDDKDGAYQVDMWKPYAWLLPVAALELWTAEMSVRSQAERDVYFQQQVAPGIAARLVEQLQFAYITRTGVDVPVAIDATLVSRFSESAPLYVSLRPAGVPRPLPRSEIARFKITYPGTELPDEARVIIESGRVRYRTPHLTHLLFDDPRILTDLARGGEVLVATPVDRYEMRNPRQEDQQLAERLVKHLNEHLEYYHQAIWVTMDPQRRYMLLDGAIAPNSNGRSAASVVENRLIAVVGNCLVMPAAPGNELDPLLASSENRLKLINVYAADNPPPIRVSVPTRGVYAEAVMGECNSCEVKDDTRFWRWEESPNPDQPAPIQPLSTDSRTTTPPDVKPTPLPAPIVAIQNTPELPDPLGLQSALQILGKSDIFRDVTGLSQTQQSAMAAFKGALDVSQALGQTAAGLAKQQATAKNADRTLSQIQQAEQQGLLSHDQAQQLAYSTLQQLVGQKPAEEHSPISDPVVQKAVDAATQSTAGTVSIQTPSESVDATFDGGTPEVGAALLPSSRDEVEWFSDPYAFDDLVLVGGVATYRPLPATTRDLANIESKLVLLDPTSVGREGHAWIAFGHVRKDPGDASKFQAKMRLHITFPSTAAKPGSVAGSKLPLVVLVHGQHEAWNPTWAGAPVGTATIGGVTVQVYDATGVSVVDNHLGYTYLQDELARQGIVSVSVDTNFANSMDSLIETRADMTLAAIDAIKRMSNDAKHKLFAKVDFTKVALIGHSRGGDAVVRAAKKNLARASGKRHGIRAVASLSPTDFTGASSAGKMFLDKSDVDFYAVLYGSVDCDVSGAGGGTSTTGTGFRHYDRAKCPKAMVFVQNCNHNRFNQSWPSDDPLAPVPGQTVRSRAEHQTLAIDYLVAMCKWHLKGDTTPSLRFTGDAANSLGVPVSLQWSFGSNYKIIDDFETPNNSVGGIRTTPLAPTGIIEDFASITISGSPITPFVQHQTRVLHVDISAPPGSTRCLTTAVPVAHANWKAFKQLAINVSANFNVAVDPPTGPLPKFKVSITDTANKVSTLDESKFVPSPKVPWFHKTSAGDNVTAFHLETVKTDLSKFTGIDLSKVASVAIDIDPANATHVFFDSIFVVAP
jgi:hypothetical protein